MYFLGVKVFIVLCGRWIIVVDGWNERKGEVELLVFGIFLIVLLS